MLNHVGFSNSSLFAGGVCVIPIDAMMMTDIIFVSA